MRSVGDYDGCIRVGGLAGGWMVESTVPSAACRSLNVIFADSKLNWETFKKIGRADLSCPESEDRSVAM